MRLLIIREGIRCERVLRLQVLVDALGAALPADSRELPTAKRGSRIGDHADVQPHHPCLKPVDHPLPASEALGEHVGHEAVLGVVREPDGVILVVERRDGEHGPKDLLPEDRAARLNIGYDRRFVEGPRPINRMPTGHELSAERQGVLQEL